MVPHKLTVIIAIVIIIIIIIIVFVNHLCSAPFKGRLWQCRVSGFRNELPPYAGT